MTDSPLAGLLDPRIAVADFLGTPGVDEVSPYAVERAHIARAVGRRRAEFGLARRCGRQALAQLGLPPLPITSGARGEPQWPDGIVGSITHTKGYCAAVAVRRAHIEGIGIDAEPAERVPAVLFERITTAPEHAHQRTLARQRPDLPWGRLLFAGKEAVYKAWWPMRRSFLGFASGGLCFDIDHEVAGQVSGSFVTTLYAPHEGMQLHGRWRLAAGLVLAAVVVPAGDGPAPRGWDERLTRE